MIFYFVMWGKNQLEKRSKSEKINYLRNGLDKLLQITAIYFVFARIDCSLVMSQKHEDIILIAFQIELFCTIYLN